MTQKKIAKLLRIDLIWSIYLERDWGVTNIKKDFYKAWTARRLEFDNYPINLVLRYIDVWLKILDWTKSNTPEIYDSLQAKFPPDKSHLTSLFEEYAKNFGIKDPEKSISINNEEYDSDFM